MSYQQFHEDVARFQASDRVVSANYFWWPDETDERHKELLKEHKQHPGSQLRTYVGMKADGTLTLWQCLFSGPGPDAMYITGFNDSFPCPPIC